jgi:ring-1,2-phenylacetyl-CoA epoxidase subunit PaaE
VFESAGGRLDYEAGQRLTLSVHAGGRVQKRCYSFSIATRCLAPGRQRPPRRDGAVSPVLHPLRTGDTLQAAPASGSFTLPSPSSGEHCYVLVGGGGGLTPLISLAETALRRDR